MVKPGWWWFAPSVGSGVGTARTLLPGAFGSMNTDDDDDADPDNRVLLGGMEADS